jgi:hypothetical protein
MSGASNMLSQARPLQVPPPTTYPGPTDNPHKCQCCLQCEALMRLERKKAEHHSKMMLDRGLRSFESGGDLTNLNQHSHDGGMQASCI